MPEIVSLGNGAYRIVEGTRSRLAYAVGRSGARWVFLEGHVYVIDLEGGTRAGRNRLDDHAALAAPMPATVATVAVAPGQRVSKGDVLIVLEAMKMELAVRSPRDSIVKAVACRPGELVQPGVPLLELE